MGGEGGGLTPGTRRHPHSASLVGPKASKASENHPQPNPPHPSLGARQDRQETSFHPAPSSRCQRGRGTTSGNVSPQKPIQSTATLAPAPLRPSSINPSLKKKNNLPSSGGGGRGRSTNLRHSQCTHMLTSDSFIKYQCICCPGDVPKTSCTIHTHHSLFLFVSFIFFFCLFFCVCVVSPSQSKRSIFPHPWFCPLVATDNLSERLSPKRGPGGTGFFFSMVQNGMLWLEHTPATLLWDSSTERPCRETFAFVFVLFFSFKNFPLRCAAWLALAPPL